MTDEPQRRRALGLRAVTALITLALVLGGCVATDADLLAGLKVPDGAPRVTGAGHDRSIDREQHRLAAAFGGRYRWRPMDAVLRRVVQRIATVTGRPADTYEIIILNSPTINAFALPNGKVYVTRGLLALARDEAEVAAVLAHEIAHVTLEHARARAELAKRSALVTRVASDVLNDPQASRIARTEGSVTLARFSRAQELEADRIGINVIARAGYSPYAAARFLMALERQGELRGAAGASSADFASTHPPTRERVLAAIAIARETGAKADGGARDDAYEHAINGMLYGDDPAAGVIRGRSYANPSLGMAFEAPENFSLEASGGAIIGIARGGPGAFRVDYMPDAGDVGLEEFIASGWMDGLDVWNIHQVPDAARPTAVAEGRGKELSYLLAAIRMDDRIFRVIYAMRQPDEQQRRTFDALLRSIRSLSPEEAAAVKPLRIRIIVAAASDTQQTLAGRMAALDEPLKRFRILNGMSESSQIRPGAAYKIVE